MGYKQGVALATFEYMRSHPNEAIFSSAVAHELGLEVPSVQSAMSRFAKTDDIQIHRVMRDGVPVRGLYIYSNHEVTDQTPEPRKPKQEFVDVPFPRAIPPVVRKIAEATFAVAEEEMPTYPPELELTKAPNQMRANGMLYEYVGDTKAGTPMVRDESGKLYVLKEV